ncbi:MULTISPECIES: ATP-binding protein [Sorangium]|uniref:ATP-binding protein n=1 Tax=Sorangium TaxID=39643 RepID=UPI0026A71033
MPLPCCLLRIEQELNNRVTNAIKYSPGGGTVQVAIPREGSEIALSVSDRRVGIAAERQVRFSALRARAVVEPHRLRGRPRPRPASRAPHRPGAWRVHLADERARQGLDLNPNRLFELRSRRSAFQKLQIPVISFTCGQLTGRGRDGCAAHKY